MTDLALQNNTLYVTCSGKIIFISSTSQHPQVNGPTFLSTQGDVYREDGTLVFGDLTVSADPVVSEYDPEKISETFESMRLWGEQTFGPATPKAIAERVQKEAVDLVEKAGDEWNEETLEQVADIAILLTRAPGLWDAMLRKMEINRNREWTLSGDGTGYHTPETKPEDTKA